MADDGAILLYDIGDGTALDLETGTVHQLSLRPETPGQHGLPKSPVERARITLAGLDGDFNRYRHEKKHDDPDMAILLYPLETIRQLNDEGWPVRACDLGENITTTGIPYDAFRPGHRVAIAAGIELQVSKACEPCTNLYLLPYVGPEKGPRFLKATLRRRGWYARVLQEGLARTGDGVRLLD